MYTLRKLNKQRTETSNVYLGDSYKVNFKPHENDIDLSKKVKLSVLGSDGNYIIFKDEFAYIMTESGQTFETLNHPIQ